jgi:hypothetical protein
MFALTDGLTDANRHTTVVGVTSDGTIGVLNFYEVTVTTAIPTSFDNDTIGSGDDRRTNGTGEVNTTVHPTPTPTITGS